MSINLHVNISVNVAAALAAVANFGTPLFVTEHTVTSNRQDGPFSSLADVTAAGFSVAAAPAANAWAAAVFAQRPRTSQVLIGRRLAAEALTDALDAIEAADPASWYMTQIELNTANELMALATWTETRFKIAMGQTSDADTLAGTVSTAQVTTITVGGTPTDGTYTVAIVNAFTNVQIASEDVVRAAGVPVDNDAIATLFRSQLTTALGALAVVTGATNEIIITFAGLGTGFTFALTAPAPGTLVEVTPTFIQNVGELGAALAFNRTAFVHHDDDTEYLDGAWAARCLGFNLDAPGGAGVWAYHRLVAITATALTNPQKTTLLGYPMNYFSPVTFTSGVVDPGFTFKGRMLSGRSIDIQTTVDLTQARMEEGLLAVLIAAAATSRPKVPYTDKGIGRFREQALDVLARLVKASHYADQAISPATGRVTPYVDAPLRAAVSQADLTARRLVMNAEAVFAGAIETVGDPATVGLTIDLSF